MFLILITACFIILSPCEGVDRTLEPGANGSSVVQACIDKIAAASIKFASSDQQLLRRIAYVETRDGQTYSAGSSNDAGGIWQLSSSKYKATKKVSSSILNAIKNKRPLKIDWAKTVWSDLRKPLYSALAARLYLEVISQSKPLATDINGQGKYWANYYTSSGGKSNYYAKFVNQLNKLEVCEVSGLDMIFLMDSSGSVGSSNFQKMKTFVYDIVNAFHIGLDSVRVGVITFASNYQFRFHLNTHSSKSSMLSAINSIPYTGGGTNTAVAINAARIYGFTTSKGARPTNQAVPRIAIVVTDGKSNSFSATVTAAASMHNAGIIGFAIGIAGANVNELNKIASDSSYVAFLQSFNANLLKNLQVTISQETCKVSTGLSSGANITDTVEEGEIKYINFPLPKDYSGVTLQVNSKSGTCVVYGSTIIHTPSDAIYDVMLTTSGWEDIYMPRNSLTNPSTADKLYLAIKSGPNVNCTATISIDKGDTSTDPVEVCLMPSSMVKKQLKSNFTACCYATGKPLPSLKWYKDGNIIDEKGDNPRIKTTTEGSSKVTSILTIPSLTNNNQGTYKCVGSNTMPSGGTAEDTKSFNLSFACPIHFDS